MCVCVWVSLDTHRTVTEITMIIMKFFGVVEGSRVARVILFFFWRCMGWLCFLLLML